MEKTIIDSFDEACQLASNLSNNLYSDSDFTPEAFLTFLDNLPTIFRVNVKKYIKDNEPCVGLCTIYFDTFNSEGNRISISIQFTGTWLTDVYFKFIRSVPRIFINTYEF